MRLLIQQFFCETLLLTLASALLGLIIAETVLPFYNRLSGLALRATDLFETSNIFVLAAIIVLVAILSGLYPAVVISGYKIAESLKSRYSPKSGLACSEGFSSHFSLLFPDW